MASTIILEFKDNPSSLAGADVFTLNQADGDGEVKVRFVTSIGGGDRTDYDVQIAQGAIGTTINNMLQHFGPAPARYNDRGFTFDHSFPQNQVEITHPTDGYFNLNNMYFNTTPIDQQTEIVVLSITDNTKPVITLNGNPTVTLDQGSVYVDVGATAQDDVDGDITSDIVIGGDTVDINTVGVYTISYDVVDSAGNAADTVNRVVTIRDATKPVIILTGFASVTLDQDSEYDDPGATAFDNVDGDITSNIITTGLPIDKSVVGAHTISYDVSDSAGNAADTEYRTVNILDTTKPVITLNGNPGVGLLEGSLYDDPGAEAEDNVDGDITSDIVVGGDTVDTSVLGTYTISYDVSDSAGNAADTRYRTVVVQAIPVVVVSENPEYIDTPFGVRRSTRGDLDYKFRVADDAARDVLITNDLVEVGHIIYHEVDGAHYQLKAYPTFGDTTGVEWDDLGGTGAYESTLPEALTTLNDLGGIKSNTSVLELTGKTFTEMFDALLFPTLLPEIGTTNSLSTELIDVSSLCLAEEVLNFSIRATPSRGVIEINNAFSQHYAGIVTSATLTSSEGTSAFTVDGSGNISDISVTSYASVLGDNFFTTVVDFSQGPIPVDSTGAESTNVSQYVSGSKTKEIKIEGVYPVLEGNSDGATVRTSSLKSHSVSSVIVAQDFTESGSARHTIAVSDEMIGGRSVTFQTFNTSSNAYDNIPSNSFTPSNTTHNVEGEDIPYKQYTKASSLGGGNLYKIIFN